MAKIRKESIPWGDVHGNSSDADGTFNPRTPGREASSVDLVRVTFEAKNHSNVNSVLRGGYQLADHEDAPEAPVAFGQSKTGNGMAYPTGTTSIGAATAGKQIIRFGNFFKSGAANTLNIACVAMVIEIESCG